MEWFYIVSVTLGISQYATQLRESTGRSIMDILLRVRSQEFWTFCDIPVRWIVDMGEYDYSTYKFEGCKRWRTLTPLEIDIVSGFSAIFPCSQRETHVPFAWLRYLCFILLPDFEIAFPSNSTGNHFVVSR